MAYKGSARLVQSSLEPTRSAAEAGGLLPSGSEGRGAISHGASDALPQEGWTGQGFRVPENHPGAGAILLTSAGTSDGSEVLLAELERRLEAAKRAPEQNVSILTWYRDRPDSWYLHREAPFAPIVFNYYLRNRPRHIFNPHHAYSDNFYGLPVEDGVPPLAWLAALNTTAVGAEIMARSRNQGDGLAKIQLFEYREVKIPNLKLCSASELAAFESLGTELIERPHLALETIRRADELLAGDLRRPKALTWPRGRGVLGERFEGPQAKRDWSLI